MADDSTEQRSAWRPDRDALVFEPIRGRWRARINRTIAPGGTYYRWHLAVTEPNGLTHHVMLLNMLSEAIRAAEAQIEARNAQTATKAQR